jgi:hypothetical protein
MSSPYGLLPGLEVAFDHEMALLECGAKRLVKREFATVLDRTRALEAGFHVAVAEGGYGLDPKTAEVRLDWGAHLTLFIGDETAAQRALELERVERHGSGDERESAMAELGSVLGYPACCVEAYGAQDDQGETATFERLLSGGPREGLPPSNNLFLLSQQLISHFPCDLACGASAAIGDRALGTLRALDSQAADALLELLAAPVTVWDRVRFLVEHPRHGLCHGGRLTEEPRLFSHPGFNAFVGGLPHRPDGGVRLVFDGGVA